MKDNKEILHFKFDVSTFRLLGRELITDRITALFELVKNCYDANADNVTITFENVNPFRPSSYVPISFFSLPKITLDRFLNTSGCCIPLFLINF